MADYSDAATSGFDGPDDEATRLAPYSSPTTTDDYGQAAYSSEPEELRFPPEPPADLAPQAGLEPPATPWYLRGPALIGWGVITALLIAALLWGIVRLLNKDSGHPAPATTTTTVVTSTVESTGGEAPGSTAAVVPGPAPGSEAPAPTGTEAPPSTEASTAPASTEPATTTTAAPTSTTPAATSTPETTATTASPTPSAATSSAAPSRPEITLPTLPTLPSVITLPPGL